MSAKITLYTEPQLIDKVKLYAKKNNTSVSKMVTNFFELIVNQEEEQNNKKSKNTSKLCGLLKNKAIDETNYTEYLENKYL